jgi:hypothetical protein
MLIYFRCRRCRIALSAATQKADQPVNCPRCKREIIVPSASEIAPHARKAAIAAPAPPSKPALVTHSPMPAEVSAKTAPVFAKRTRNQVGRGALVAVAIGLFVLVAGGWMTGWAWSKWKQAETQLAANLADSSTDDADAEEVAATADAPVAVAAGTLQPDILPPDAGQIEGVSEEEEDPAVAPRPKAGPENLPDAKGEDPVSSKLEVKRRKEFSEEDLRKQLLWAPEVGISPPDVVCLVGDFRKNQYQDPGDEYLRLEPTYILAHNRELKTLPFHRGLANRVDQNASRELQSLGQELHLLMDQRAAAKTREKEPSTVLLAEFMKLETRQDKKPNWLRPEAVPTLQQILGHEDLAVRLMLVDLLARIDGRASSVALVQHAVFDLSSEVRDAAIKALDGRPREQYRSALVADLRYPWAPAADHAAEALVALKDGEAAPLLVRMLSEPDPSDPVAKKDSYKKEHLWKREVVRMKHMDNCVVCHPPANSGNESALGIVPGFVLVDGQCGRAVVSSSPLTASASKSSDYQNLKGGGFPLLVRADITYLRQDFSIQQPNRLALTSPPVDLRFDYVVRFRPLTESQTREWKAQTKRPDTYEQREAVLFALRELTGQDAGPTTEAWQKLYPTSEFEEWTQKLTMTLVDAPDLQKLAVIKKMRDAKGVAYTEALAQAIPQLAEPYQPKARAALVERMKRMSQATLRDKLAEENREIRLAAATAAGLKEEAALIPDLTALLQDADPEVAEAAQASLKSLEGAR